MLYSELEPGDMIITLDNAIRWLIISMSECVGRFENESWTEITFLWSGTDKDTFETGRARITAGQKVQSSQRVFRDGTILQ